MRKTYTFEPLLSIGDTVFIIRYRFDAPNGCEVIETKIDDIRCFCLDSTIEYSTEDSEHFEGQGWFNVICFSENEIRGADSIEDCDSETLFLRREDAEKTYTKLVKNLNDLTKN